MFGLPPVTQLTRWLRSLRSARRLRPLRRIRPAWWSRAARWRRRIRPAWPIHAVRPARVIGAANLAVIMTALAALLVMPGEDARPRAPQRAAPPPPAPPSPSPPVRATPESARRVKANELGLVPVIMYHRIVKKRQAAIDRTPGQLRRELERLARSGYVPVTAAEFVTGRMDIPAGAHPVVLTFDDGHPSHFALDAAGLPAPETAVGILYDVARRHPGFRPVATFWVNREPFGLRDPAEQRRAVRWLVERGFEVANHTYAHPDLRRLGTKQVREQIARQERLLLEWGAGPSVTLALPYGSMPVKRAAARKGKWRDVRYEFAGVFLAGAEPSVSPFAKDFDRHAIQRIQSNGRKGECRKWCSEYWLGWLERHPGRRYTSDGDPQRVSIPKRLRGNISAKVGKRLVVY